MGIFHTFIFSFLVSASAGAMPADLSDVEIKDQTASELSAEDKNLFATFFEQVSHANNFSSGLPVQHTHLKKIVMNSKIKSQYYEGRISIQTACVKGPRLPSLSYLPVLLHEYAHTLFEVNLEHFLLKEKLESIDNDKKFDDGEKSFNFNVPIGIIDLAAPYNEFFADLYAVLTLGDPQTMSFYFSACNGIENHRNFSSKYEVDSEKIIQDLTAVFTDVHVTLDPARTFIWEKYQSLKHLPNAKELVLSASFFAAKDAISDFYHGGTLYKDWAHTNLVLMNSDFISRINQRLP